MEKILKQIEVTAGRIAKLRAIGGPRADRLVERLGQRYLELCRAADVLS